MSIKAERIVKEIKKLGETPDEIAQALKRRGIKGYKGVFDSCPIANFVSKKVDVDNICVEGDILTFEERMDEYEFHVRIPNREPIRQFISNFDNGYYDFLEED